MSEISIDYATYDKIIPNFDVVDRPTQDKIIQTIEDRDSNKLGYTSFTENADGSFDIVWKGCSIHVPADAYVTEKGGNAHNFIEASRIWTNIVADRGLGVHPMDIRDPGIHRTGFWFKTGRISRDPSIGGPYDKVAIEKFIIDNHIVDGRIIADLYTKALRGKVEQLIVPSSKCEDELVEGIKTQSLFPCVNGGELRKAGLDTDSIDWESEESIKGFVDKVIPVKRNNYEKPQLVASLEIKNKSIGVYGFGTGRIICVTDVDYDLSDRLASRFDALKHADAVKGGRGDTQAGGRNTVSRLYESLFKDIDGGEIRSAEVSMRLALAGAAVVHRIDCPNLAGVHDQKILEDLFDWAMKDKTDLPIQVIAA